MSVRAWVLFALVVGFTARNADTYPLDAYSRTGIERLDWQNQIDRGVIKGRKSYEGARWSSAEIELRMTKGRAQTFDVDPSVRDPALQAGLENILRRQGLRKYGIALLDITDPAQPRYAGVHEHLEQTPGSVAKVLPATALLAQIARRFPEVADRERFLRSTFVTADRWAMPNGHKIPVALGAKRVRYRPVRVGDRFSLWQWLDHALSISSNAAATMVFREATLMSLLGDSYPPESYGSSLWLRWSRSEFSQAAYSAIDEPQKDAGLAPRDFHLRAFFTGGAIRYIERSISRTSPLAMVRWLLRMEQGRIVDPFTSRELKRLIYVTIKRIRYAHSKKLGRSAVYFKSGSLYECAPEPGYGCGKYRGNKLNVLNSMAIVETRRKSGPPIVYLVGVMSNELRRNAADDHSKLGGMIHDLVVDLHR